MGRQKNILIIGNGEDYTLKKINDLINNTDCIIAADGGLKILDELKTCPDFIIGDSDSCPAELLNKYEHIKTITYKPEKNYTDSELAIKKALEIGAKNIYLAAVTGNYLDHSLANIYNLCKYRKPDLSMTIITGNSQIFPIFTEKKFKNIKDRRFSLIPLTPVKGLYMEGCKYQFPQNNIGQFMYGISNIFTSSQSIIKLEQGILICILFDMGFM